MPPTTAKKPLLIPARNHVAMQDTWDLSRLFASDDGWLAALRQYKRQIRGYAKHQGELSKSPQHLKDCLAFDAKIQRRAERLGIYAFLRAAEDQTNGTYQRMRGRFQHAATQANEAASFIGPEINAMSSQVVSRMLAAPELAPYRVLIERIRRYRKHTLSLKEERLLAMQGEMADAPSQIFRQLLDADLKFGVVKNERGQPIELTNASLITFLQSPQRDVRRRAFEQFYAQFAAHENCLTASLAGAVQRDVYYAKVRGHNSSLEAALFPDNVPPAVYHNLVASVRCRLPVVHRYFDMRRRTMRLKQIHHYDTYVPILAAQHVKRDWNKAVRSILNALRPLGNEYCQVLSQGLQGRWCDRYANRGKQSGAFSCGSYDGDPHILMNYKPEVLEDMFTLAHEAGHSMHSYFSARHQPFIYYDYSIFVAEVASTFNEQLLSEYLRTHAADEAERAYLINREVDAIRGTLIRQTMFAEFEAIVHRQVEQGEPLTVDSAKKTYRELLEAYFGADFALDDALSLECLRIPHFYRAFYVYKYATGLAAAIALSRRVLHGGPAELEQYLGFLRAGCSKDPLEILKAAGVDMTTPQPIEQALDHFESLIDQLDQLL